MQTGEVIMSFNWWKRQEMKPQPKSHFPIKVKIEQAPEEAQSTEEPSDDFKTADADNPSNDDPAGFYNEEEENA